MIIDINIKVEKNKVHIDVPELNSGTEVEGAVMILGKDVVGIGINPEEEKKFLIESLAEISEEEFRKNQKITPKQLFNLKLEKLRELHEYDKMHGTLKAWDLFDNIFTFVYPFSFQSFDPEMIVKFLAYYSSKITQEKLRKGYMGIFINLFFDQYNYNILIDDIDKLSSKMQAQFEEVLKDSRSFLKAKTLFVNGMKLF